MPPSLPTDLSSLDRLPPGLRFELERAFERVHRDPGEAAVRALWRLLDGAEPWVGLEPSLAETGYALLDPSQHHGLRRFACAWLTHFPTVETMQRLAAVALDEDAPISVREQATWSLGYRQARSQPEAIRWPEDAVAVADRALVELAHRATETGKMPFDDLPLALRHVRAPELFEVLGKALPFWGNAVEAFAPPSFARMLLERLEEVPNAHQLRAMRLAAAVLEEEAVSLLLARARDGGVAETLELHFLALTFGGEAQLDALERIIAPMSGAELFRQRARFHLAHPGVVQTIEGLRIARTTALMPGEQRASACAKAADDFAALMPFVRHAESYLYTLWAEMVRASGDVERARVLAMARPEARETIKSLHLRDLARRGRARQVIASAQMLEAVEEGAYWLAIHGRPFMALELAETSRFNTPKVAVARVLGLLRVGRPDLAKRVLAEELPPGNVTSLDKLPTFPGDDELWHVEHHPEHDPSTTALLRGMAAVTELAQPAPADAEPDSLRFETIAALERWLARPIDGASVYLAGDFPGDSKEQHTEAILGRGGRLVDGPFPGTHYYVMGLTCPVTLVARLERQGTRRIRSEDLGLSW